MLGRLALVVNLIRDREVLMMRCMEGGCLEGGHAGGDRIVPHRLESRLNPDTPIPEYTYIPPCGLKAPSFRSQAVPVPRPALPPSHAPLASKAARATGLLSNVRNTPNHTIGLDHIVKTSFALRLTHGGVRVGSGIEGNQCGVRGWALEAR